MKISLIDSSYSKICSLFNFSKAKIQSSADINKKMLVKKAKRGDKKPGIKTKVGEKFYSYTYEKSSCYDEEFTKKIKKIRPDWFLSQYDIANQKKQKLIEIAKKGYPRPKKGKSPLAANLGSYINKSQGLCYDPAFTKTIKKLRPDWFVSQSKIANKKKQKLIKLAKSGKPRPKFKTELGKFLGEHTTKKDLREQEFSKQIKKLRPDWFVTNAEINRQKLLKMAKSGDKKPMQKTKMGMLLYSYIRRSNNSEFKKKLKKIRPDWFVTRSDVANMKKKKLLVMAKKGCQRRYDSLGSCLCNYISKGSGSYDPIFYKQIKKIRPDWFKK